MYRDIELAKALSQLLILKEVDELKHQVDALRPLSREVEDRVLQKFRLDWNYHSNAIEGNPYTYGETVAFLMEGITAKGKTLKDHLDIKGHDDAVHYLLSVVKDKDYRLTESEIRNLHKTLLKEPYLSDAVTSEGKTIQKEIKLGAYKSMPNHVKTPTGAIHYYASPEETPIKMGELVEWFNEAFANSEVHPAVVACLFHHQFTAIHPFDDGNGRMARLLMNLILMQKGYPPVVIKQQDRNNYYQVLRQADAGDYKPLIEYNSELLNNALGIYLKGARGETVDEFDDVDKEIALFKLKLGNDLTSKKVDWESIQYQVEHSVIPLFQRTVDKLDKELSDLFFENSVTLVLDSGPYQATKISSNQTSEYFLFLRALRSRTKLIGTVELRVDYKGFKKVSEPFNIAFLLTILFGEYKFRINYAQPKRLQVSKFYNETLTVTEIQDIVRNSLKTFFEEIKQRVKDSNSLT